VGQHGLVVITREGNNPNKFIYESDLLTKYQVTRSYTVLYSCYLILLIIYGCVCIIICCYFVLCGCEGLLFGDKNISYECLKTKCSGKYMYVPKRDEDSEQFRIL
jgi:hypothetical protein